VALFFGSSGTSKATLSADTLRRLIGADEHGWSDHSVFNFEGGCYAKVIDLDAEAEPQIYHAIRFGSILENVIIDPQTRVIDYSSDFLSGFTSKVAGTEVGIGEPRPTFSPCYGAPFMPLHPDRYATMLAERLAWHEADCWLVNTGWTGGPYGTGHRMSIELTRGLLTAALDGALAKAGFTPHPVFKVLVPDGCCCAAEGELDLRATWADKDAYDATPRAGRHVRRQLRAVPRHGHRGGAGGGAGRCRVDAAAGRRAPGAVFAADGAFLVPYRFRCIRRWEIRATCHSCASSSSSSRFRTRPT